MIGVYGASLPGAFRPINLALAPMCIESTRADSVQLLLYSLIPVHKTTYALFDALALCSNPHVLLQVPKSVRARIAW
jgi:hypothetical protein